MSNVAIFTDLDGTFIDFESYSGDASAQLARSLAELNIPLFFCSSKTKNEQKALMAELNLTCAGITENGSGFFLPKAFTFIKENPHDYDANGDWVKNLGTTKQLIEQAIDTIAYQLHLDLKPYKNYTIEALAQLTGLSPEAAERAQNRDFSETLTAQLSPAQWNRVNQLLKIKQLQAVCGGRFHTVSSIQCDKGKALQQLMALLEEQSQQKWISIALGDSTNDLPMFQAADYAYLVQKPDQTWNPIHLPNLKKIAAPGPLGWIQAVTEVIKTHAIPVAQSKTKKTLI